MPDPAAALRQLQEVGDHIAEVIELRAQNADLRSKLDAAERRIERARETLWLHGGRKGRDGRPVYKHPDKANDEARAILSGPANAEGIASEGGF